MIQRRRPARSGIQRVAQREWPRHRKFVRGHRCVVPGCDGGPIEFAHVRSAANAGTGLKPHDAFAVSLCSEHHRQQHQIGMQSFEALHKVSLSGLAVEFVRRSPDAAMRESLKLAGA